MLLRLLVLITIWFSAALQNQIPAARGQERLCRLEGQVINSVTSQPVQRAVLSLYKRGGDSFSATSDAEGRFVLDDVEPGVYILRADKAGYLNNAYGAASTAACQNSSTPLTLAAGQQIKDLRYQMLPQAVIAGLVLDDEGEPLGNRAAVQLYRQSKRGGEWIFESANTTNDGGDFRFSNLHPGRYALAAQASSGVVVKKETGKDQYEEALVNTFYPGVANLASAAAVEVGPGQEAQGIDIRLRKSRVYRVKGKLSELPADQSTSGMFVALSSRQPQETGLAGATGGIGPNGSFEITTVEPGSYHLDVMRRGNDRRPRLAGRVLMEITNQSVKDVVVSLFEPVRVAGSVVVEGNDTVNLDRVQIALRNEEGRPGSMFSTLDRNRTFSLEELGPDLYYLLMGRLPNGMYVKTARAGKQDVLESGLDLRNAHGTVMLELVLGTKPGAVEGTVSDDNKPAPGSRVLISPHVQSDGRRFFYHTGSADQNGHFEIHDLAPGKYALYAWHEICDIDLLRLPTAVIKGFETKAVEVTVKEGVTAHADLKLLKDKDAAAR